MKKEDITTPLTNYISGMYGAGCLDELDRLKYNEIYLNQSMSLYSSKLSSKQRHLSILGKQKYCITFTNRNWVWEGDNWRAYVNKEGTSFEVLTKLTFKQAWAAWEDYFHKMNQNRKGDSLND